MFASVGIIGKIVKYERPKSAVCNMLLTVHSGGEAAVPGVAGGVRCRDGHSGHPRLKFRPRGWTADHCDAFMGIVRCLKLGTG